MYYIDLPINYFEANLFNNLWPDKKVKVPKPARYHNVENISKCIQKHTNKPKIAEN